MKHLYTFLFLCTSGMIWAQLPGNLFNITEDSPIVSVHVTDLNYDGVQELVVLREADDIIIYYQNNGEFFRDVFVDVDNPLFVGYDDLNIDGAKDLYYSARSFDGFEVIHGIGESPYELSNTSFGQEELSNVNHAASEFIMKNFPDNVLATHNEDGQLDFYHTFAGSFFYLATQHIATIDIGGPIGQIATAGGTENLVGVAITDLDNGRIRAYRLKINSFSPEIIDTTFIDDYLFPYGVAGVADGDSINYFITDKNTRTLIYSPLDNPIIIDDKLTDPGKIYIFDFDDDGEEEVYVEDGKQIVRYTDVYRNGAKEVVFTGNDAIKNFVMADIDGDGRNDFIIVEENSQKISLLTHELLSLKEIYKPVNIYPNPVQDYITISENISLLSAKAIGISGIEINLEIDQNTLNVSKLPIGQYILIIESKDSKYQANFVKH